MSQTKIAVAQPITPADRAAAGRTLARAFADDPVLMWLSGRRHARFAELAHGFFTGQVTQAMAVGGAWMVSGDRAAALWQPLGAPGPNPVRVARLMPAALRLFGPRIGVALTMLKALERKVPQEPHWHLEVLGTDPDHQGQGHGSVLLAPVLDRCDRDGMLAYLESSNERNVPFYERNSFRVTERFLPPGGGPPLWLMRREPA